MLGDAPEPVRSDVVGNNAGKRSSVLYRIYRKPYNRRRYKAMADSPEKIVSFVPPGSTVHGIFISESLVH